MEIVRAHLSRIKDCEYLLNPKQGNVIQLRSDFWIIHDQGLWREMTEQEYLDYD